MRVEPSDIDREFAHTLVEGIFEAIQTEMKIERVDNDHEPD